MAYIYVEVGADLFEPPRATILTRGLALYIVQLMYQQHTDSTARVCTLPPQYRDLGSREHDLTDDALGYFGTSHATFPAIPFLCHMSHDDEINTLGFFFSRVAYEGKRARVNDSRIMPTKR